MSYTIFAGWHYDENNYETPYGHRTLEQAIADARANVKCAREQGDEQTRGMLDISYYPQIEALVYNGDIQEWNEVDQDQDENYKAALELKAEIEQKYPSEFVIEISANTCEYEKLPLTEEQYEEVYGNRGGDEDEDEDEDGPSIEDIISSDPYLAAAWAHDCRKD